MPLAKGPCFQGAWVASPKKQILAFFRGIFWPIFLPILFPKAKVLLVTFFDWSSGLGRDRSKQTGHRCQGRYPQGKY